MAKQTRKISSEQFVTELKSATSLNNKQIIFLGEEVLRMRRLAQWISEKFFAKAGGGATISYFGSQLTTIDSAEKMLRELNNSSLFERQKLVILYDLESLKAPVKKALFAGLEALKNCPNFLIATYNTSGDKRGSTPTFPDSFACVEFSKLAGQMFDRWLQAEAKRSGASGLEPEAVKILAKAFENDSLLLAQEIEKLALLVEPGALITATLVKKICDTTAANSSFELLRCLAAKNTPAALHCLKSLDEQGFHPLQTLALLNRAFRTMLAQSGKNGSETLHADLSNPWFVKNVSDSIRKFSGRELQDALETLKQLDETLKSSGFDEQTNLALAMQRISSRAFIHAETL